MTAMQDMLRKDKQGNLDESWEDNGKINLSAIDNYRKKNKQHLPENAEHMKEKPNGVVPHRQNRGNFLIENNPLADE